MRAETLWKIRQALLGLERGIKRLRLRVEWAFFAKSVG